MWASPAGDGGGPGSIPSGEAISARWRWYVAPVHHGGDMRVAVLLLSAGLAGLPVVRDPVRPAPAPCPAQAMAVPAGLVSAQVNASDPTGRYQVGVGQDAADAVHLVLWRD